jgi:hypothetical protein
MLVAFYSKPQKVRAASRFYVSFDGSNRKLRAKTRQVKISPGEGYRIATQSIA